MSEWTAVGMLHVDPEWISNVQCPISNPPPGRTTDTDTPTPTHVTQTQGGSSQFPGVLVGTPHVRKCHQMSSKEHIQLGWVVRWVLSTPPGHPAARRCVRVVPVLPLLLCTRPARARPSIGGQSPTPAPRQLPWSVESSPALVISPVSVLRFRPAGS
jgi:hypothetical protein